MSGSLLVTVIFAPALRCILPQREIRRGDIIVFKYRAIRTKIVKSN